MAALRMHKRRYVPSEGKEEATVEFQTLRSIYMNWEDIFDDLLPQLKSINLPLSNGKSKWTPLMFAIQKRRTAFVRTLLNNGADPNCFDHVSKKHAIHTVCASGAAEIARLLLQSGRIHDINVRNNDEGETPLLAAVKKSNIVCVQMLLDYSLHSQICDINLALLKTGQTALWIACDKGDDETVQLLLDYRHMPCDMNAADAKGYTPLMKAVSKGREAVVAALLQHGADVNRTNYELQQCATVIAIHSKNVKLTALLLAVSGNKALYRRDYKQRSLLDHCVQFHAPKIITQHVKSLLYNDLKQTLKEISQSNHSNTLYIPNVVSQYICDMTY